MTKLCALDLSGMKAIGVGIADRGFLDKLLQTSPAVARFRLRLQEPALVIVSDAGFDVLAAAGATSMDALVALGENKKAKKALLAKLSPADGAVVGKAMDPTAVFTKAGQHLRITEKGALVEVVSGQKPSYAGAIAGAPMTTGKHCVEMTVVRMPSGCGSNGMVGVASSSAALDSCAFDNSVVCVSDKGNGGNFYPESLPARQSGKKFGRGFQQSDVIKMLLDCDACKITFKSSNTSCGTQVIDIPKQSFSQEGLCWLAVIGNHDGAIRIKSLTPAQF